MFIMFEINPACHNAISQKTENHPDYQNDFQQKNNLK